MHTIIAPHKTSISNLWKIDPGKFPRIGNGGGDENVFIGAPYARRMRRGKRAATAGR
jgi:hypothetical protein